MIQVFTDAEAERLAEIKRTHDNHIPCTLGSSSSILLGCAEVRHSQRGELLTMLDTVAARARKAIDDCTAAVLDANKACERADARSRTIAELQADLHRLRENHESISDRTHVSVGFHKMVVTDREKTIENLRRANAQLRRENDNRLGTVMVAANTKINPSAYLFDTEALGGGAMLKISGIEAVTEKPSFHIKRADAHKYTVEVAPANTNWASRTKNLNRLIADFDAITGITTKA